MQIFQIHHGRGTDAHYLHQFRNDNVSKAAAFFCKCHMFFNNICFNIVHNINTSICRGDMYSSFFFLCRNSPIGPKPPPFLRFQDHNQLHRHTHTHTHTRSDSSERVIRASQRSLFTLATHTTHARDVHPCPRRDSNPQSQ